MNHVAEYGNVLWSAICISEFIRHYNAAIEFNN